MSYDAETYDGSETPLHEWPGMPSLDILELTAESRIIVQEQSFHRFPCLPWDIRDMIWKMALRPEQDGVHWFGVVRSTPIFGDREGKTVEDQDETEDRLSLRWTKNFNSRSDDELRFILEPCALEDGEILGTSIYHVDKPVRYSLTAPKVSATTHSWRYPDNVSTYSWDMGLWGACCESRRVITENVRLKFWTKARNEELRELLEEKKKNGIKINLKNTPVLALADVHGEVLPIMVKPWNDLFILNLEDFGVGVDAKEVLLNVAYMFGREKTTHNEKQTPHIFPKNIGIEYDISWYDVEPDGSWSMPTLSFSDMIKYDGSPRGALARILLGTCKLLIEENRFTYTFVPIPERPLPHIWLIDTRLHPRCRSRDGSDDCWKRYEEDRDRKSMRFYGMDGTVYMQTERSNRHKDEEKLLYPSAWNFINRHEKVWSAVHDGDERDPGSPPQDLSFDVDNYMGVLSPESGPYEG